MTQKTIQVPTCSSSITLLHIDSKLRHVSGSSALCDLFLHVLDVDEQTSIGTMDFGCSWTVGKHTVTRNRPVASSQNGNLLSKKLPPKTATNGHLAAIFSKKSVRCFKTA